MEEERKRRRKVSMWLLKAHPVDFPWISS